MEASKEDPKQVDGEEPEVGSDLTSQIVDQLRRKPSNKVATYLAAHKVIQRPFQPASYLLGAEKVEARWNLNRGERAMAMAVYIFEEEIAEKPNCRQCSKNRGPNPAPICLVPSSNVLGMACTNCFYSGRSSVCSLAVDERDRRREEETQNEEEIHGRTLARCVEAERQEEEEDVQELTPALLEQMSLPELEVLQRLVGDAIERRRNLDRHRRRGGKRKPTSV